jgi:hypothetical protein
MKTDEQKVIALRNEVSEILFKLCPPGTFAACAFICWQKDQAAGGKIHYYYTKNTQVPIALSSAADAIADELDMLPVPADTLLAVLGMMKQRIADYENDPSGNTNSKRATAMELTEFVDYINDMLDNPMGQLPKK